MVERWKTIMTALALVASAACARAPADGAAAAQAADPPPAERPPLEVDFTVSMADGATAPAVVTFDATEALADRDEKLYATYEWDLGNGRDAAGWFVGSVYEAGQYTVELTVTLPDGRRAVARKDLEVTGASEAANPPPAIRAPVSIGSNTVIENGTFGWAGTGGLGAFMFRIPRTARNVVFRNCVFDGRLGPVHFSKGAKAARVHGSHVAFVDCEFRNLNRGLHMGEHGPADNVVILDCSFGTLGDYVAWVEGRGFYLDGVSAENSIREHNLRGPMISRITLNRCTLANATPEAPAPKSVLWAMQGDHCYVVGCPSLRAGSLTIGPHHKFDVGEQHGFAWAVVRGNRFEGGTRVEARTGVSDMLVIGNRFTDGARGEHGDIQVRGHEDTNGRTAHRVDIVDNHSTSRRASGGMILVRGGRVDGLLVQGNRYDNEALETRDQRHRGNIILEGGMGGGYRFVGNELQRSSDGRAVCTVGGGVLREKQWLARPEVDGDTFH